MKLSNLFLFFYLIYFWPNILYAVTNANNDANNDVNHSRQRIIPKTRLKSIFNFTSSDKIIIRDYLKIQKDYSQKFCKPGSEEEFYKLAKDYKGDGIYIPELLGNKFDRTTVIKYIPEIKEKIKWIKSERKKLEKIKDFTPYLKKIKKIEKDIHELLKLKEKSIFLTGDKLKAHSERARKEYQKFAKYNLDFYQEISFFLSYRYPLNHLILRREFDYYKKNDENRQKANDIYFYRKIVQDGAQNKSKDNGNGRNDLFLRAIFDTLSLHFTNDKHDYIPDNIRVDVSYILTKLQREFQGDFKRDKEKLLERMTEWSDRTERTLKFYENLINDKIQIESHTETAQERIKAISHSRENLKKHILEKEAETYLYFSKQKELIQALYVLETILYNEVGRIDGSHGLERRDIAQVVINRFFVPYYSEFHKDDSIATYLESLATLKKTLINSPWLNVLFKEGEFSFTYFFIDGSLRIYCPDMSKRGERLRRENLKIALELLRKPRFDFHAIRYFSRNSMHGRIDMTSIWEEYQALPIRIGHKLKKQENYKKAFKKGNLKYLNHFKNESELYRVLQIRNETVLRREKDGDFFGYRDPHHFVYFKANY